MLQYNKQSIKHNSPLKKTKPTVLTLQEQYELVDPKLLRAWASYSLNKRCALIKEKFNKSISRVTLAKYYQKHNIKYIRPDYTIHTDQKDQEIHQDRLFFVQ